MNELSLLDIMDMLYAANAKSVGYDKFGTSETVVFNAPELGNRRVLIKSAGDNLYPNGTKSNIMDFRVRIAISEE